MCALRSHSRTHARAHALTLAHACMRTHAHDTRPLALAAVYVYVRALRSGAVMFEVKKPADMVYVPPTAEDDDSARFIRYDFGADFFRFKTIGTAYVAPCAAVMLMLMFLHAFGAWRSRRSGFTAQPITIACSLDVSHSCLRFDTRVTVASRVVHCGIPTPVTNNLSSLPAAARAHTHMDVHARTRARSLTFRVGNNEVPNFRMIERHYFRNKLLKNLLLPVWVLHPEQHELVGGHVRRPSCRTPQVPGCAARRGCACIRVSGLRLVCVRRSYPAPVWP